MADPDLQIRGGGGGGVQKIFFGPYFKQKKIGAYYLGKHCLRNVNLLETDEKEYQQLNAIYIEPASTTTENISL